MLHTSAQCYEYRFGYCTNVKTCLNVHFGAILAERRVLLGSRIPTLTMNGYFQPRKLVNLVDNDTRMIDTRPGMIMYASCDL